MFAMFLYNIGVYLTPTAENPREPKHVSALTVECSDTDTIKIKRFSKAYVNIL